jgi:hypothetical protein
MMTLLLVVALVALAAILCRWMVNVRRRNAESWDSLVARLGPDWNARGLTNPTFSEEGQNATPEDKWKRVRGAHGLWTMYENAGVMLEMASYACRNSVSVDCELIAAMRSDALQIRYCVLRALVQYAFRAVNESTCANVLRAESAYAEMLMRATELLQASAPDALPSFVAAM